MIFSIFFFSGLLTSLTWRMLCLPILQIYKSRSCYDMIPFHPFWGVKLLHQKTVCNPLISPQIWCQISNRDFFSFSGGQHTHCFPKKKSVILLHLPDLEMMQIKIVLFIYPPITFKICNPPISAVIFPSKNTTATFAAK